MNSIKTLMAIISVASTQVGARRRPNNNNNDTQVFPPMPPLDPEDNPEDDGIQGQGFKDIKVTCDGDEKRLFVQGEEWSTLKANDYTAELGHNNRIFLQGDPSDMNEDSAFQPMLLGGSITYDIDFKDNSGCGCESGLFAVDFNNDHCSWDEKTQAPSCPTIDVMRANQYGFTVGAHPCDGGSCDI